MKILIVTFIFVLSITLAFITGKILLPSSLYIIGTILLVIFRNDLFPFAQKGHKPWIIIYLVDCLLGATLISIANIVSISTALLFSSVLFVLPLLLLQYSWKHQLAAQSRNLIWITIISCMATQLFKWFF